MKLSLKDRNALVCGSSKGIGQASAVEIALLGANVTLIARNEKDLQETKKNLDVSQGQKHDLICADFARPDDLKKIITEELKTHTWQILVNNTGGPHGGNIIDAKEEEFINAFRNHVLCNHILATLLIPGMKASKYGRIINIISTSVKIPIKGLGVSNTIRAAVANWSKTLSNELAPFGITVNNVLPGSTRTQRLFEIFKSVAERLNINQEAVEKQWISEIPFARFAEPEEIGAGVAFLASPAASYITGINLTVDGGRTGSL